MKSMSCSAYSTFRDGFQLERNFGRRDYAQIHELVDFKVNPDSPGLTFSIAVIFDLDGNIIVSGEGDGYVRTFDRTGE